ncbi:MAG: AmmeMemoRadiSam system protein B [Patescibacteria group bacterium]
MKKAPILLCLAVIMAASAIFALSLLRLPSDNIATPSTRQPSSTITIKDQPNNYINYGLQFITPTTTKTDSRILLVPHHLLPVRQIGEAFAEAPNAKRVILLSPDHFSGCKKTICTTGADFTYEQLTIQTTPAEADFIEARDSVFLKEHGIRGLLPFVATRWPDAQIVPITIKADATTSTVDQLAGWITQQLQDKDTYLVSTIDLSHYLPAYLADIHDRVTIRDLLSIDPVRWRPMEIDNPPIARITLAAAKALGLKGTVLTHTNSIRLMQSWSVREGTSHVIMSYGRTGQEPETVTTTLYTDPTRHISSQEDRYYWGFDRIVTTTTKQDWATIETATGTQTVPLPTIQQGDKILPVTDAGYIR